MKDIEIINSQFVKRSHAEKLRKLGFNEPCVGFFSDIDKTSKNVILVNTKPIRNKDARKKLTAPMHQQAISFLLLTLKEIKGSICSVELHSDNSGTIRNQFDKEIGDFNCNEELISILFLMIKRERKK